MKHVLVISGFDPSNQAGYGLDVITLSHLDVLPIGVISCQTLQTDRLFKKLKPENPLFFEEQLKLIFKNQPIHAVKIGMVYSRALMEIIFNILHKKKIPVIIDPLHTSSTGTPLISTKAISYFKSTFLTLATILTPNFHEACWLANASQNTPLKIILKQLQFQYQCVVILKGGHLEDSPLSVTDWFYDGKIFKTLAKAKINLKSTHGSGCLHSSIVAALKAKGVSDVDAFHKSGRIMDHLFTLPNDNQYLNPPTLKRFKSYKLLI